MTATVCAIRGFHRRVDRRDGTTVTMRCKDCDANLGETVTRGACGYSLRWALPRIALFVACVTLWGLLLAAALASAP